MSIEVLRSNIKKTFTTKEGFQKAYLGETAGDSMQRMLLDIHYLIGTIGGVVLEAKRTGIHTSVEGIIAISLLTSPPLLKAIHQYKMMQKRGGPFSDS